MTPDEAVRAVAARLDAVDWKTPGDKAWSRAKLLLEYFRRAARWAAAYGPDTRSPFFDIAGCVDPAVRADQRMVAEAVEKVRPRGWNAAASVVPFILHWAALTATSGVDLPADLEDPYEPLLVLPVRARSWLA